MPKPSHDAFELKNSGLDVFLYADVGAEANGSPLTIFSVLGRLGLDPWAQAASWAALPNAGAIDGLAHSIDQMPLMPGVLADSRAIAARLIQLLPGKQGPVVPVEAVAAVPAAAKIWSPVTMVSCGVAVGVVLCVLLSLKHPAETITPVLQPVAIAGSTAPADVRLDQFELGRPRSSSASSPNATTPIATPVPAVAVQPPRP